MDAPTSSIQAKAHSWCDTPVNIIQDVEPTSQVMIVLDRSKSMDSAHKGQTRLHWAKEAVQVFLEANKGASPPLKVGFVEFNQQANQIWPSRQTLNTYTGGQQLSDILTSLNNIKANGKTGMGRALEATRPAFQSLGSGPRTVLLLSDGAHNEGPDPEPIAEQLRQDLGVRVFSIPFSESGDDSRMTNIAGESGGEMFDVDEPDKLSANFFSMAAKLRGYHISVPRRTIGTRGVKVEESGFPKEEYVAVPVSPGSKSLNLMFSAAQNPLLWGVRFELVDPNGNIVLNDSDRRVSKGGSFQVLRLKEPIAGEWFVRIWSGGKNEKSHRFDQRTHFLAYSENNSPDCAVDALRDTVQGSSVEIAVQPYWDRALMTGGIPLTVVSPDGVQTTLTADRTNPSSVPTATFDNFTVRGDYQVRARCDIEEGTPAVGGEAINGGPANNIKSPAFSLVGQTSFYRESRDYNCSEGDDDCDDDGISNSVEQQKWWDMDDDGTPNYVDLDSDNDEVSDLEEGPSDCDRDGVPNYLDEDSDNDKLSDTFDECPCIPASTFNGCP